MITGIHTLVFSSAPEETRTFLRDALKRPFVDSGGGWLIFAMPPLAIDEAIATPASQPMEREE